MECSEILCNEIYQAWIDSYPTNALCVGFNILDDDGKEYIFITRNPLNKSQVLAKTLNEIKDNSSISLRSKYLTDSEEEFAFELLRRRGL